MSSTAKSILITASTGKNSLSTDRSIIDTQSIADTSAFWLKEYKKKEEEEKTETVKIILFLYLKKSKAN